MDTDQLYKLYRESAGVVTDSRIVGKNQIYFALRGENFNGNKFAPDALKKGASWAVIDDPAFNDDHTILVEDSLAAMQKLAAYHRKQMDVPVLAITGTNGKTTTKELVAAVLSRKYRIHYTKGNLNNHIGVPLTILSAPVDTELMIIEMGANHPGEIDALCRIADPDYGMITNIGTAHIEGFGSFEGVVKTKTELYEHLKRVKGIVLYNDKDPLLSEKVAEIMNMAVPFSSPAGKLISIEEVPSGMNLSVDVSYEDKTYRIDTSLFGRYNYWNVRAAVATGIFFKVNPESVVEAISGYKPSNNRSQIKVTGKNTLICDSYNANPSSMNSALESFVSADGRKLAILGDMLELGPGTIAEHTRIIEKLKGLNIREAFLVGSNFQQACSEEYRCFADVSQLKQHLEKEPVKGYTILIKGSRGIGLEKIYDFL
jgi:UDP-N-acetylmuramoyl-tripeptide--D-alanyl-D-alanine ligase